MNSKLAKGTRRILSGLDLLRRDERGGILMTFAVAAPAIGLLVAGALDLFAVSTDKDAAQAAVDAAALNVAGQVQISTAAGVQGRAQQLVDIDLAPMAGRMTYTVTALADNQAKNLTVELTGQRQSFFMNMLPPGGWTIHVKAIAQSMGEVPLCVLSTGSGAADKFSMVGGGKVTANGCLIQSDSDIVVSATSALSARTVQAVGLASGPITPTAQTGAANIPDPFASMTIAVPGGCTPGGSTNIKGTVTLPPGNHCGDYNVHKGAVLNLAPGDHYFLNGKLDLKQDGQISGTDVALIFDKTSYFSFGDQSAVVLDGRKTGPFAGFVIATTNANTNIFEISSDNAKELLGTIYIPSAQLLVTGTGNQVNTQAAWTVIVAKSINLTGNPVLTINSNYAGSSVPVPQGVGPTTKGVVLTK